MSKARIMSSVSGSATGHEMPSDETITMERSERHGNYSESIDGRLGLEGTHLILLDFAQKILYDLYLAFSKARTLTFGSRQVTGVARAR